MKLLRSLSLLDCTLLAALSLITTGSMLLWGSGWACLILGGLLLLLILFGIPAIQPSSSR